MKRYLILILFAIFFSSCGDNDKKINNIIEIEDDKEEEDGGGAEVAESQAYGADISWVTGMEKSGVKFYNEKGAETDCFALIKEMGGNTIRLRVWVNPSTDVSNGMCDKTDVVAKSKRAAALGMRLMIDFHYSDSWADPGKQNKPAAWKNHTLEQLKSDVADHTTEVLEAIKAEGVDVEWVQIGNETKDGMLWDDGRCSTNPANYAALTKAGADAARNVYPNVKVIVHINNGWAYWTPEWIVDQLKAQGAHNAYDVIGVSYYPSTLSGEKDAELLNITTWQDGNEAIASNAKNWVKKYNKKVMVVEFGYANDKLKEAQECLSDLIDKTHDIEGFEGILMWEPECHKNWNGYGLGLFTSEGKPGVAFKGK
ncbi:MAG: glycosyl hydrolase 53 family protein [Marinilabiliaceae bacterium]|nr:glycosyl hydrolase 53 family protein [Marinilabiliaceae bacterium]